MRNRIIWAGITLGVGAICLSTIAVALASDWHVEFGTVPAWVSAIGSIATCIGVGIAAASFRAQRDDQAEDRRADLEEQANQARLVSGRVMVGGPAADSTQAWKLEIVNRSDRSIHDLRIHRVIASVEDGQGPVVLRRATNVVGQDFTDAPSAEQLAPHGQVAGETALFIANSRWVGTDEKPRASDPVVVRYSFIDADGRAWVVDDNSEPKKVRRPGSGA